MSEHSLSPLVHLQCPQCLEILKHHCHAEPEPTKQPSYTAEAGEAVEWELNPEMAARFAKTQERREKKKRERKEEERAERRKK